MSTLDLSVRLRPVSLPDDAGFLRELYASRREDLKMLPLESTQLDMLINLQYEAQDRGYRAEFPSAEHYVIEIDHHAAGRYLIDRSGVGEDAVIDIAVLPEYRGRGIASKILMDSIAEARRSGRGLTLHVDPSNPALHLYLRLGGEVVTRNETSMVLSWPPNKITPGETDE